MKHPNTYTLTREEWRHINRALSGAALALAMPRAVNMGNSRIRLKRVREAQDILSASYARAEAGK